MYNLKYIKDLVAIKSYSTRSNKKIIDYLYNQFLPFSKEIIKIKNDTDNKENLLVGINCDLKNINDAIILSGHIDTVVADKKEYKTNPYKLEVIDDKMYGLGVCDMKSFFATILQNIKTIRELNKPIIVAITSDEETNLFGIQKIVDKLKEINIKPKLTIVGEPTDNDFCLSCNGCYEYKISIKGRGCHSSKPNLGINANYIAAKTICFIEKLSKKLKSSTITSNIVSGGEKINVVSSFAEVRFDIRSKTIKQKDEILNKVKKYIKVLLKKYKGSQIDLEQTLSIPPLENKKSKLVKDLVCKMPVGVKEFSGGCEAGYFKELSGEAIIFGVGSLSLAHKPNEFVSITEFEDYALKLIRLLEIV